MLFSDSSGLWAVFIVCWVLLVSGSNLILADLTLSPRCALWHMWFQLSSWGLQSWVPATSSVQLTAPAVVLSLGAGSLALSAGSTIHGS